MRRCLRRSPLFNPARLISSQQSRAGSGRAHFKAHVSKSLATASEWFLSRSKPQYSCRTLLKTGVQRGRRDMGEFEEASHSQKNGQRQTQQPAKATVNVLCLIGAIIGLAAVFLSWSRIRVGFFQEERSIWHLVSDMLPHDPLDLFVVSGVLFVFGSLLALVTPTGGLLQAIGLAGFYVREVDMEEWLPSGTAGGLAIGWYLGIFSAALVLTSMVLPLGMGYSDLTMSWSRRLRVFFSHESKAGASTGTHTSIIGVISKSIKEGNRLSQVLAIVILIMVASAVYANFPDRAPEPLREVEGGILWTVDFSLSIGYKWNVSSLILSDGTNSVVWITESDSLEKGSWSSVAFETKTFNGMALVLTVTDWNGDGRMDVGDLLTLTTTNQVSFADGVPYTLSFNRHNVSWIPPPHHVEIFFEFQNGDLESRGSIEPKGLRLIM